jgi:hypothetical protein
LELYVNARTSQKIKRATGINDGDSGLRPSHQALLQLIDMTDPSWPHTAAVLREMKDAGVEIGETALAIAAKIGAHRFAITAPMRRRRPAHHQATLTGTSDSIVYYISRGELIKIGTTADPVMRFGDLMPDKILAFEPGDDEQENLRHRQFDHLRCRGEHFRRAPELMEHIRQIRRLHGDPDPSWPSAATSPARFTGLPPLISHELVTAAEARKRFGIDASTVSKWVSHGLITPAERGEHGRHLFYAEHLAALRARNPARKRRAPTWSPAPDTGT